MKRPFLILLIAAVFAPAHAPLSGQIMLSGSVYFQDFNELALGLSDGWAVYTNSTPTTLGSPATFTSTATSWAGSASGTSFRNISSDNISPDASAALQSANLDRALGFRPQTAGTRDGSVIFALADTIGFQSFALSVDLFTGNNSGATNQSYNIEYRIGMTGAFISLGSYETTAPFSAVTFTAGPSLLGALNDQPEPVYFRFHNPGGTTDSSYDTLGIDNFSLSYSTVPEPSTSALVAGAIALSVAAWRRRRRQRR